MSESLLDSQKTTLLLGELSKTKALDGAMAEIGVYRGGTARLMADTCPEKPIYLYDTFTGVTNAEPGLDSHRDGDFACTSPEAVREAMSGTDYILCQGVFPGTFQKTKLCFVHSDTDTYYGAKSTLDYVYPCLVPGGVIVFDDYNLGGIRKALSEAKGKGIEVVEYGRQAVVIKNGP